MVGAALFGLQRAALANSLAISALLRFGMHLLCKSSFLIAKSLIENTAML